MMEPLKVGDLAIITNTKNWNGKFCEVKEITDNPIFMGYIYGCIGPSFPSKHIYWGRRDQLIKITPPDDVRDEEEEDELIA